MTRPTGFHSPTIGDSGTPREPGKPVVGIFDSGVGGLSVLPALRSELPHARFVYVADSAWAPYGERDDDCLQTRCSVITRVLQGRGANLMVMACNTATAAAAPWLRAEHPDLQIVGMEPAVKPAVLQSRTGRVGVMATLNTLSSQRYARLLADHAQGALVVAQPCTGLALAIEHGDEAAISRLVDEHTEPLRQAQVDTVVLGCTHYHFARPWIEQAMGPAVAIIDTAHPVARRAATLIAEMASSQATSIQAPVSWSREGTGDEFWTSGDPRALEAFAQRWLGWTISARSLTDEAGAPGAATTAR